MLPDMDDVFLAAVRVSLLAQADDMLLVSLSARGLGSKLSTLESWCARNFILINKIKTVILIFKFGRSPLPIPHPVFMLGANQLKIVLEEKYVGVTFRTDTQNMFAAHYKAKARTGRYCGHRIMAVEDMTGRLSPKDLKEIYMARVDCHLTNACEVMPDCEDVHLKQLSQVQIRFIRNMLNLHPRSMIAPLFTETGIMPLRVRRLLLVLTHLVYWLGLDKKHLARAALDSSLELSARGKRCWSKDLITAASRLPFLCPELVLNSTTTVVDIQNYAKNVDKLMMEWLQAEIDSSDKLYLLQGRLEPQKDKPPKQITSTMRHYLTLVKTQTHREALTSIMLSTHQLAVEILRYVDHEHGQVARENRLCRFCKTDIETPEHALITCTSQDALVDLREKFLEHLFLKCPNLRLRLALDSNVEFLKAIIHSRPSIALVAKFAHDVLQLFYAVPVFRA
ncbi:hypothetical protein C8R47DRAFT_1049836 [Mycena vitilis]|nr:hypothetical protein C8R47DRAFT_1049836 [Mycena vitilis]